MEGLPYRHGPGPVVIIRVTLTRTGPTSAVGLTAEFPAGCEPAGFNGSVPGD
jgi:hypothetical protein